MLKFCLRGFLGSVQRKSLFTLIDVLSSLLNEKQRIEDLETLELHLNIALSKIERDFPATLQVCTLYCITVYDYMCT